MSGFYQPNTYFGSNVLTVGVGARYSTISAALAVASAGDTIEVGPGTYTETLTIPANNITINAVGKPNTVIIQQADANVVNCSSYTGVLIQNCILRVTAATSAISTVTVSTGLLVLKECQISMTSSENIVAASQPSVGSCTSTGTLEVKFGKVGYYHTGACGGSAIKSAFTVDTGGEVNLDYVADCTISNSGTALVTAVAVDLSSTGIVKMKECRLTVTDPNATIVAGLGYISGTGSDHEFWRNSIHIIATANSGYGIYAADAASTTRSFFNHIHVVDTGGASYSFFIGASATLTSQFDDIIADDGVTGTGTFTYASSQADGNFSISGALTSEDANTILKIDNS